MQDGSVARARAVSGEAAREAAAAAREKVAREEAAAARENAE